MTTIDDLRLRLETLERENTRYQQAHTLLLGLSDGILEITGREVFQRLVRRLCEILGVSHAFITECVDETFTRVRTLSYWNRDQFMPNFEYALDNTPCQAVIRSAHPQQRGVPRTLLVERGLSTLFPDEGNIEGYLGIPLLDTAGGVIGHMVIMNDKPIPDEPLTVTVLQLFASKAAGELQRLRLETERERMESLRRRSEVAEALRDILVVLNSEKALDDVLGFIVGRACQILRAPEGEVCRPQASGEPLQIVTSFVYPSTLVSLRSVMNAALATNTPQEWRHTPSPDSMPERYRAALAIPIDVKAMHYGCLLIYYTEDYALTPHDQELAAMLGEQCALAIENATLRARAAEMAAMEERNRIARELHDAVSQTLWSANLIADVLPDIWQQSAERGRFKLEQFRQLTRAALVEMRSLLLELRPKAVIETPIRDLLQHLVSMMTARSGIPIVLTFEGGCAPQDDVQLAIYRVAQEALNNAVRHASAKHIEVLFRCAEAQFELVVMDDGLGFAPVSERNGHHGLAVMNERANSIGATFSLSSDAGRGTVVRLSRRP
jgi:signal transduction histidine kinase